MIHSFHFSWEMGMTRHLAHQRVPTHTYTSDTSCSRGFSLLLQHRLCANFYDFDFYCSQQLSKKRTIVRILTQPNRCRVSVATHSPRQCLAAIRRHWLYGSCTALSIWVSESARCVKNAKIIITIFVVVHQSSTLAISRAFFFFVSFVFFLCLALAALCRTDRFNNIF